MFIKSELVCVVSVSLKQKKEENGDLKNYGIIEVGDSETGITEDIFVNSQSLDLIKDLKKGDYVSLTLKNRNGRFNLHKIDIMKA